MMANSADTDENPHLIVSRWRIYDPRRSGVFHSASTVADPEWVRVGSLKPPSLSVFKYPMKMK